MANRLSKEKACAIAAEYYTNGFNKIEALLSVGYSDTYAKNTGLKLFVNDRVVEAMRRLSAVAIATTGYSIEQAQAEYEQARIQAIRQKQPSAAVSAITGKARLHGFDKDASADKPEQAMELSKADIATLQAMSKKLNESDVDTPTIHKLHESA